MQRHSIWAVALALAAAIAAPALAADATTGGIHGKVIDGVTGCPFPIGGGHLVIVDAFNTTTLDRYRVAGVGADGGYAFSDLPTGQYKVRFRHTDASRLDRYMWHGGTRSFDTATPVQVMPAASLMLDAGLPALAGAMVSGTITEQRSGDPLGNLDPQVPCYFVELYEASGISIGMQFSADAAGSWSTLGLAPAGEITALAAYSRWCGDGPPHLDRWYEGASGWPFQPDNLVADPRTFATADLFIVTDGVAVPGIDIALLPAPTCGGNAPTIFGTTLSDRISGTAGPDVIVGLAGRDVIRGLGGNDVICGNAGPDRLVGGAGHDILLGNRGNDVLLGRLGDDILRGGVGIDTADGGLGTDVCVAETISNCP